MLAVTACATMLSEVAGTGTGDGVSLQRSSCSRFARGITISIDFLQTRAPEITFALLGAKQIPLVSAGGVSTFG